MSVKHSCARTCSEQPHKEVKHLSLQAVNQPLIVVKTKEEVYVEISLGLILGEFSHLFKKDSGHCSRVSSMKHP